MSAAKSQQRRKRISKPAKELTAAYGTCLVCEAGVSIPGLCAYLCPSCGWVQRSAIAQLKRKYQGVRTKPHSPPLKKTKNS